MRFILAAMATTLYSALAMADVSAPEQPCPSGGTWVPWKLPAMQYAETPIFAGNKNTHIATICNCTKSDPSADAGVWIATLQEDAKAADIKHGRPVLADALKIQDIQPGNGSDFYYLAGGACAAAGPGSVILRTADHRGEKWGQWMLEPPPKQ